MTKTIKHGKITKEKQMTSTAGPPYTSSYRGVYPIINAIKNSYNRGRKWNAQIQARGKKIVETGPISNL